MIELFADPAFWAALFSVTLVQVALGDAGPASRFGVRGWVQHLLSWSARRRQAATGFGRWRIRRCNMVETQREPANCKSVG